MKTGYTRTINYYRNVDGFGWMFESFKTTEDGLKSHLRSLIRQKISGKVRSIELNKVV